MMGLDMFMISQRQLRKLLDRNIHHIFRNSDATTLISSLKTANAFDYQTRAVFINANFYSQGMDLLLEIELVASFSLSKLTFFPLRESNLPLLGFFVHSTNASTFINSIDMMTPTTQWELMSLKFSSSL